MGTHKITLDLNREKAIEMILDGNVSQKISINCNCSTEDLESYLDSIDWTIDNFKDECRQKQKEIIEQRNNLKNMMTHEIYEKGESEGLWHLNEKQKRLI